MIKETHEFGDGELTVVKIDILIEALHHAVKSVNASEYKQEIKDNINTELMFSITHLPPLVSKTKKVGVFKYGSDNNKEEIAKWLADKKMPSAAIDDDVYEVVVGCIDIVINSKKEMEKNDK